MVNIGGIPFLHARLTYAQDGINRDSHVYLAGFRGQYVKIRATYFADDAQNGARMLSQFLAWLAEAIRAASK